MNSPDINLAAAMARHQIELPPPQVVLLERYCELLWDWNAKINLTRHTDYEKFVARDLVDSLAFAQFLPPKEKVLDVGAGGGVPGVVLAIVRTDLRISLSESVGKKARALAKIVERLGLQTPVLHARAEDILIQQRFNTLVVRAVARLKKFLEWFRPHWKSLTGSWSSRGRRGSSERAKPGTTDCCTICRCESDFVSAAGDGVGERAANLSQSIKPRPHGPLSRPTFGRCPERVRVRARLRLCVLHTPRDQRQRRKHQEHETRVSTGPRGPHGSGSGASARVVWRHTPG